MDWDGNGPDRLRQPMLPLPACQPLGRQADEESVRAVREPSGGATHQTSPATWSTQATRKPASARAIRSHCRIRLNAVAVSGESTVEEVVGVVMGRENESRSIRQQSGRCRASRRHHRYSHRCREQWLMLLERQDRWANPERHPVIVRRYPYPPVRAAPDGHHRNIPRPRPPQGC